MKSLQEVIDAEIASIVGAASWYDGISWEKHLAEWEKDEAYEAVFNEMLRRAREFGTEDPIIHHNGNGNYVACARKP